MTRRNAGKLACLIAAVLFPALPVKPAFTEVQQRYLDIKPESCVNPLNITSSGKVTMAILGSFDFDVTNIVRNSLLLLGDLAPAHIFVENVSAPPTDGEFSCGVCYGPPDGYADLVMQFYVEDIVEILKERMKPEDWLPDTRIELTLKGYFNDESNNYKFEASDCVELIRVISIGDYGETKQKKNDKTQGSED